MDKLKELIDKIISQFGGESELDQIKMMLGVQRWHGSIVPGNFVVGELPPDNHIYYAKILTPGKPEGLVPESRKSYYQREADLFSREELVDYRMARLYRSDRTDGETTVIHVSTIRGVVTSSGFEEARRRGWPNTKTFAITILDEDFWKKVKEKMASPGR